MKTQNLINNDTSRCNNHRCALRTGCARYMQLAIDAKQNSPLYSVTRFGNQYGSWTESCGALIPTT